MRCGANGRGILFKNAREAAGRRPAPPQLPSAITAALLDVAMLRVFVGVNGGGKTGRQSLCVTETQQRRTADG